MHPIVCFVASKSGGHIVPCLTLATARKQQNPSTQIIFFTGNSTLDATCMNQQSCIDHVIVLPIHSAWAKNIRSLFSKTWQLVCSFFKSLYYSYRIRPTTVISTGGLIALPVCSAAFLLRIHFELYELNVVPGKAIKLLAPYATSLFVCFEQTAQFFPKQTCHIRAYPIRFAAHNTMNKTQARQALSLSADKPTIAILGGSQGSHFLNRLVASYNRQCMPSLQFIHQTGTTDSVNWKQWYQDQGMDASVCTFELNPERIYSAADIIICRAGSGILHEIIFFGKKCITIPLPEKMTDHQLFNARACAQQYPEQIYYMTQEEVEHNPAMLWHLVTTLLQAIQ